VPLTLPLLLRLHNRVHGGGIEARMLAKDASFD
jgi:hypothetical protein